ncbi:mediator of RNA polymerase II transcription subunit 7-like isoform X2 [Crassostrea virginica]|uniref:Mediator of RNA polymerase II transcription subunit 7 n=1 Tax=Crassostrea virginica TaxID=6565 RepID=A0A8B8D2X6_CRAVI|nr:mediator of RNA polymerase II transcription subunit 7-like [Crassostrea virginica]XP_022322439.1 mediator of RNA polymerase II transcription subunit 7-like [Crassostrea virginica]XP_022322440.1 mediator of RNA polymerase II transcription subunit 7-like [Crassostrea virginica]
MAENQGVSAFPLPPSKYFNMYTDENVKRGRVPLPPPPIQDTYTMFGAHFNADDAIIRPLESQGFRRLHPQNYDHKRELKKLNHSILVNFLDLIDILIKAPDSTKRTEKLEDLNLLFIHMHHLINEFRPHQARETLRVMMERQKKERAQISKNFETHLNKVKELIQTSLQSLPEDFSFDSKSLVKTELLQASQHHNGYDMETEPCDQLDRMMCDIVDGMG